MARIDFLEGLDSSRLCRLLQQTIKYLELDLRGARVLTEAGSREYAITPVIAAAAGAEVFALTSDSPYANVAQVRGQVKAITDESGVGMDMIRVVTERSSLPSELDIITNLGFVRPVDKSLISRLGPAGVVSYMCESWECRDGDVDIEECSRQGVSVAGVWEDFGDLSIFRSCGQLAVKLCFESGLEVVGNQFVVISSDEFAPVIASALKANLAQVHLCASAVELTESIIANADAIVVADYTSDVTILGRDFGPSAVELAHWNPSLRILQFAGKNDVAALTGAGLRVFPNRQLASRRMAFTLAHLGVRPIVLLHTAGLKVGELLWRARVGTPTAARFRALVQPMNLPAKTLLAKGNYNEDFYALRDQTKT